MSDDGSREIMVPGIETGFRSLVCSGVANAIFHCKVQKLGVDQPTGSSLREDLGIKVLELVWHARCCRAVVY
jgi:hypothetical protein